MNDTPDNAGFSATKPTQANPPKHEPEPPPHRSWWRRLRAASPIIMMVATFFAAIAAIASAIGVFRQETATYTTALWVKEVDAFSTYYGTHLKLRITLNAHLLSLFNNTFSKPYPAANLSVIPNFMGDAKSTLQEATNDLSVLAGQTALFKLFTPPELANHFALLTSYDVKNEQIFANQFVYIAAQLSVAVTNPQQQMIIDVEALRRDKDNLEKLADSEMSVILSCIKPQLSTGRPIRTTTDMSACK